MIAIPLHEIVGRRGKAAPQLVDGAPQRLQRLGLAHHVRAAEPRDARVLRGAPRPRVADAVARAVRVLSPVDLDARVVEAQAERRQELVARAVEVVDVEFHGHARWLAAAGPEGSHVL